MATDYSVVRRSGAIALLVCITCLFLASSAFASDGTFVRKFGTSATLNGPSEVAVDAAGNAFVADTTNNRIRKFDSAGTLVATYGATGSGTPAVGGVPQFNGVRDVALDSAGNLYVADMTNNRVQKLSSTGTYLSVITGLTRPRCVEVDASGNVYVSNTEANQIRRYDSTGSLISQWGSAGTGNGQFNWPVGLATDSSGNVYVTDYNNHRVQKFNATGTFIATWGSSGTGNGQFAFPTGIDVDTSGFVYVSDRDNERVQKFTDSGAYMMKWGSSGTGDGQFAADSNGIRGITFVPGEGVYVADYGNNRVQVFGNTAPVVDITAPTGGTVSGNVAIAATATDANGIDRVQFYVDSSLIGTDSSAPFEATWNSTGATAGSHVIEARAYDTAGISGSDSVTVSIAGPPPVVSTTSTSVWSLVLGGLLALGVVVIGRRRFQ